MHGREWLPLWRENARKSVARKSDAGNEGGECWISNRLKAIPCVEDTIDTAEMLVLRERLDDNDVGAVSCTVRSDRQIITSITRALLQSPRYVPPHKRNLLIDTSKPPPLISCPCVAAGQCQIHRITNRPPPNTPIPLEEYLQQFTSRAPMHTYTMKMPLDLRKYRGAL